MLKLIAQRNEYITISELATIFGVTERTVRDDLVLIEDYLKDTNVSLVRSRSLGVTIKKNNFDDEDITKLLIKINKERDYFSSNEREDIILQFYY